MAAVFGAGLWILNFHGISTALLWISGRTSLLATVFAVFRAVALVRGRQLWAGWLTLASLMSKEEPIMRRSSSRWLWIDRRPAAAIARMTWPSFAGARGLSRIRSRTDAFTPAGSLVLRLSVSPEVLLPNAISYLDRSMTFTAAVLLLAVLACPGSDRPQDAERAAA
jgi:hypothetical protein